MRVYGIHYDIGTMRIEGSSTRPTLTNLQITQEIGDISQGLGANAIRITGGEIDRMAFAAEAAARYRLEVWLSPMYPNASQAETLNHILEAARLAENIRGDGASTVIVLGCELSVFMAGILPGATHADRLELLSHPNQLIAEVTARGIDPQLQFDAFLREATDSVRSVFKGPITYASGMWEDVDWAQFDFVGVDAYRDASSRQDYPETLRKLRSHGIPVIITEVGCATYRGAANAGGLAWTVVERSKQTPSLRVGIQRDEEEQARELLAILDGAEESGVEGVFIYTYIAPSYPSSHNPRHDLDAASYALVRTWANGQIEQKAAYRAIADAYARSHPDK